MIYDKFDLDVVALIYIILYYIILYYINSRVFSYPLSPCYMLLLMFKFFTVVSVYIIRFSSPLQGLYKV